MPVILYVLKCYRECFGLKEWYIILIHNNINNIFSLCLWVIEL